MNLIPISQNILINPEYISCIEQVEERGKMVLYVWCEGRKHEYMWEDKVPIGAFLDILKSSGEETKQFFAG